MARPWNGSEAVGLVAALSGDFRRFGYEIAIGNRFLVKDRGNDLSMLDLYLISLEGYHVDQEGMFKWLQKLWGPAQGHADTRGGAGAAAPRLHDDNDDDPDPDEDEEDRRERQARERAERDERDRRVFDRPADANWAANLAGAAGGNRGAAAGRVRIEPAVVRAAPVGGIAALALPQRYSAKVQFKRPNDSIRLWILT